ncbi:MAG: class II aldolase/adducin family protein [Acetivibrionales bacterium]|jgi:ribulose-5-phosphate 4-epimerase/fuculose-1-phosphate aldolase
MIKKALEGLEYISQKAGNRCDYTQGGGGNTSAKLDDTLMAVKASGFKLKQVTAREGFVVINYKNIKEYHNNVELSADRDYEKESAEFVRSNVVEYEGLARLRPSVEAGFHSILQKYVIHTHAVYANILCCAQNGSGLVRRIFGNKDYKTVWIPYISPGFALTLKINEYVRKSLDSGDRFPQVIFMENHGLIVTDDDAKACAELHDEINDTIKAYLGIDEKFPEIRLREISENTFRSDTRYLIDIFRSGDFDADFIDSNVLYPDQLVYLHGNFAFDGTGKKLNINPKTGDLVYTASLNEAMGMEETLAAYFYIISWVKKSGLTLKTMSDKDIGFILNWEGEAYRKSIIAKGKG